MPVAVELPFGSRGSVSHIWLPLLVWGLPFHLFLARLLGAVTGPSVPSSAESENHYFMVSV